MTEQQLRNRFIKTAEAYWGFKESDGTHKQIIDTYNAQANLPRGYTVRYGDEWCATYVSAIGVQLDMSGIVFPECSCNEMIELYKAVGRWREADYAPQAGDIVMYDWQGNGMADHTGIIINLPNETTAIVIEGNNGGDVTYRSVKLNAEYIFGYCLPDFKSISEENQEFCDVTLPVLKRGAKGECVKTMQILLIDRGFDCGEKAADGSFGKDTESALKEFQKSASIEPIGVCRKETWEKLLGV